MRIQVLRVLSIGLLVLGVSGAAAAQGRGNQGNGNENGNNGNANGNTGNGNGNGNNGNGNGNGGSNGNAASVPEIDPSSAGVAAALLAGGLLVIRGRQRDSSI